MINPEELQKLKEVELIHENYTVIKKILGNMQRLVGIELKIKEGEKILRGRPISENEKLTSRADFSYKPQQYNTHYARASTPHNTMFYGSIFPDDPNPMESPYPRITIMFELFAFMRDKDIEGKHKAKVNFGVWKTRRELNLFCICQYQDFPAPSNMIQKLYSEYTEILKQYPEDIQKAVAETTDFLCYHFANDNISSHTDYMISAIFTEIITEMGFDGILYPSVRMGGGGLNIAITPKAVNRKLKFIGAGECCVYKEKANSYLNNLSEAVHQSGKSLKYRYLRFPETFTDEDCWRVISGEIKLPTD